MNLYERRPDRERAMREESLRAAFDTVELDFRAFSPLLQERLLRSSEHQKTLDDDFMCARFAGHIEEMGFPESKLRTLDWKHVRQASTLTDLGKTGSALATLDESILISRLYGVDANLPGGPAKHKLSDFLNLDPAIAIDRDRHLETLTRMGLSGELDMRTFFNEHARWTYELLQNEAALAQEVKVGAGLHHFTEGVLPSQLAVFEGNRLMIPSLKRELGEQEMWVLILDKYQAQLRRGRATHEQAMTWLHDYKDRKVALDPYPAAIKAMFERCLDQLDKTMQTSSQAQEEVHEMQGRLAA